METRKKQKKQHTSHVIVSNIGKVRNSILLNKALVLMLVLIGVSLSICFVWKDIFANKISSEINPGTSTSDSIIPSVPVTAIPSITNATQQETYTITGIDYLDGSWDQAEEFKKNKCKITSNVSNNVVVNCNVCAWNVDETSINNICLAWYSQLQAGKLNDEGQYFIVAGGEGGDYWMDIYFLRFVDNSLKLIERPRYTTDEDNSADYNRIFNKYKK
jgi:hypothetical protein